MLSNASVKYAVILTLVPPLTAAHSTHPPPTTWLIDAQQLIDQQNHQSLLCQENSFKKIRGDCAVQGFDISIHFCFVLILWGYTVKSSNMIICHHGSLSYVCRDLKMRHVCPSVLAYVCVRLSVWSDFSEVRRTNFC